MAIYQMINQKIEENGKVRWLLTRSKKEIKGKNWYIDYYFNGRRVREKIGPNRKQAEIVLKKRKVEIAENRFLDVKKKSKVPFEKLAKLYLDFARTNKKSYKNDETYIKRQYTKYFGGKNLSAITPLLIEQYKTARKAEVSGATVNRELAVLKFMFNKGRTWGMCEDNPVTKVKFFKENNNRTRYLELGEIKLLIDSCEGYLKPVVLVALNTGMRRGEILNLTWNNVDFNVGILYIIESKSGKPREIPLNNTLVSVFNGIKKNPDSPYVFLGNNGQRLNKSALRHRFDKVLKDADIRDFRFHDLRHTFASHLVMKGADLMTVKELLGHRDIEMTMRYSHLSPNHKKLAVQLLDGKMDTIWTRRAESVLSEKVGLEKSPLNIS